MPYRFSSPRLLLALVASLSAFGAGCGDPLVSGECEEGWSPCDGVCRSILTDEAHCGVCNNRCAGGERCLGGMCIDTLPDSGVDAGGDATLPPMDGSPGGDARVVMDAAPPDAPPSDGAMDAASPDGDLADGAMPDAEPLDGTLPDASPLDSGSSDGTVPDGGLSDAGGCNVGELQCSGVCIRPESDPAHCGRCDNPCADPMVCATGVCQMQCLDPLRACGSLCVDTTQHPDHCGMCGNACSTGICRDSACVTPTAGHVVVIGHDYQVGREGMNRIVGNAIFLAEGPSVRVVAYEGAGSRPSIQGADRAIDQVAAARGRAWTKTTAEAADVPASLAAAEVFLVYAQHDATDVELQQLAADWAPFLQTFVNAGGVVVLLDGNVNNQGTFQLLAPTFFDATATVDVTGADLMVSPGAAGDAVVLGVPLSYRGERSTVRFIGASAGTVVEHVDGPVVFHRVTRP